MINVFMCKFQSFNAALSTHRHTHTWNWTPHAWKAPLYVYSGHSFFLSNNVVAHNDSLYRGSARQQEDRGKGRKSRKSSDSSYTEMQTSGNVDSRLSFLHYPPKQQQPIPKPSLRPPDKHNSIQSLIHHMGWLRTLHEVLHEVQTITIRFYDCNGEFIFVSGEIRTKIPQKPNYKSKKI